jgi:hypothetical protein
VPKAVLLELLGQKKETLYSPATYVGGTGVRLSLWKYQGDSVQLGVFVHLQTYELEGRNLTSEPSFLSCKYAVSRIAPDQSEPVKVTSGTYTLTSKHGWGKREAIPASAPSDLEPYLVDGHLKLRLEIAELL